MPTLRKALSGVSVAFSNGHKAQVISVDQKIELPIALKKIGLQNARPALVLIGGASQLGQPDHHIQKLFTNVLAPLAEELGAIVVDGGTDAGVMQLMGHARATTSATFPLVGVAPRELVNFPDSLPSQVDFPNDPSAQPFPLEPNHTHFVLVPGSKWGDESAWIAWTASVLAEDKPSITILVNGGEVSLVDIQCSRNEKRPIAVVAGTGRLADKIANAVLNPDHCDPSGAICSLLQNGQVHSLHLSNPNNEIEIFLRERLSGSC